MEVLLAEFPTVDRINIEETLEACDGDVAACAAVLRDVLAEEAAEAAAAAPPSFLRSLLDTVSHLAQLPREAQPEASRVRLLEICTNLEASGIHITRPVGMLLDGAAELSELTAGLDEADAEVVRQMFGLVYSGGVLPRGDLSQAERSALAADVGSADDGSTALAAAVVAKQEDLAKKMKGLDMLTQAVAVQRAIEREEVYPASRRAPHPKRGAVDPSAVLAWSPERAVVLDHEHAQM